MNRVAWPLQVINEGKAQPAHPASIYREQNQQHLIDNILSLTDYLQSHWPHVHLFDSLEHLGSLLKEVPLVTTSRLMRAHTRHVLDGTRALWRSILDVAAAQSSSSTDATTHAAANLSASYDDAMQAYYPVVYRNFLVANSLRESCL